MKNFVRDCILIRKYRHYHGIVRSHWPEATAIFLPFWKRGQFKECHLEKPCFYVINLSPLGLTNQVDQTCKVHALKYLISEQANSKVLPACLFSTPYVVLINLRMDKNSKIIR